VFGRDPEGPVAAAPGRVNLIGEHTDYNDGFVLPMAIDQYAVVAGAPREDGVLRVHAVEFDETREARVADLHPPGSGSWADYVLGPAWALRATGPTLPGADLLLLGTLPVGGGLSSSAAVEIATLRWLAHAADLPWDPGAMALTGQRAEVEFVGVRCGIMDQLASAAGVEGAALLVDCRSTEWTPAPLPTDATVVIMDTAVPRTLAASGYNQRRAACERAVATLRALVPDLKSLRDVDGALLSEGRMLLDAEALRCAQHVVAETCRPHDLHRALAAGDLEWAGRLMDDSHWSLRDLYEVSCPELDRITGLARTHPACFGARLTGAGFGGAAVALVAAGEEERFATDVEPAYRKDTGREGRITGCRAVAGAALF
jgi:galactokinase